MIKLLSANLTRLWKNKVFWLGLLAMTGLSAFVMLNGCRQAEWGTNPDYKYVLDNFYFNIAPAIGIFFAVFISLFIGTEYSDGTIRNKIMVGHTRRNIYFANLLTCMLSSSVFVVGWWLGGLVGIPVLGTWQIPIQGLLTYFLISLLFSAVITAIMVLIGMLWSNKAASAIASILIFLGILLLATMLYANLSIPEMSSPGIIMTEEGIEMMDPVPNPGYLTGITRTVYKIALNTIPTGQAILMANVEISQPVFQIIVSALLTVVISLCGCVLFNKKDLK